MQETGERAQRALLAFAIGVVSGCLTVDGDPVMLWRQAGTIVAARFDAAGGGWSEPQLVASDAASAPDAATRDDRTAVVWTASAGDLRYTTLR